MNIPGIDHRSKKDIIENIGKLAGSYVPEWRFTEENPDLGSVLAIIFADMFEGTVKRYNNVLYKHHISFLNNMDIGIKPSIPSKGFVCFEQSADFISGVFVPSKTKLIANPDDGGDNMIFETQRSIFVTPAAISSIIYDSPVNDRITLVYDENDDIRTKRMNLFDLNFGKNMQKHFLSLCHESVLNTSGNSRIKIFFEQDEISMKNNLLQRISDSANMQWVYYSSGKWKQFDRVSIEDSFLILEGDNISISKEEYGGVESCWIGCEATNFKGTQPMGIKSMKVKTDKANILPEIVYVDDMEQNCDRFHPFGEELSLYRECYIACREALSKAGAKVTVSFGLSYSKFEKEFIVPVQPVEWKIIMRKPQEQYKLEKEPVVCDKVIWEYWNGLGWARLNIEGEAETVFDNSRSGEITLSFICPENMKSILVNAYDTYWIRMRLVSSINIFKTNCCHYAPVIKNLKLQYMYEGNGLLPQKIMAENNTVTEDITHFISEGSRAVLFKTGSGRKNTLYIGFDKHPEGSPISIYFGVDGKIHSVPALEWEYYSNSGKWKEFKLSDRTGNFADPGIVTLIIPDDLSDLEMFGKKCFWIKIMDVYGGYDNRKDFPVVQGIYMNSVEVLNEETMEEEIFFVEEKKSGLSIKLARGNVLQLKVMVNEQGIALNTSSDGYEEAVRRNNVEISKDSMGSVDCIWILWHEVENFINSGPEDRHYTINRITGEIQFGDGKRGMIPPKRPDEAIRVMYSTGGGKTGNLSAGRIDRMADAMRFIGRVYNPVATHGGSDSESVETVVRRGADILKHSNRAVTEEDFEALAMEASRSISKVKCVSNIDREGIYRPGRVTVAVLLQEYEKGRGLFLSERENISAFLSKRASCSVVNGRIHVIEPVFVKISIKLWIRLRETENVYEIQRRLKERISDFIDPLKGNFNHGGWQIGELPDKAQIFSYVKSLDIVGSIERLIVTVSEGDDAHSPETDMDELKANPFYMGINGTHDIIITYE